MAFNPIQNYQQGFSFSQANREQQEAKAREKLLEQQRESFFKAKDKGDSLKQLIASQPSLGMAFQKEMQTDEQGVAALVDDSVMIKHLLELDPTGQSAMELLQDRKRAIANKPFGGNSVHTDRAIRILSNKDGPSELLDNMNSFLSLSAKTTEQTKESKTADQKNFEQLQELEKNGTPEQVATYKKLLGLVDDPKLSSKAEKAIIDSQDSFFKFGESARKMELLASDYERLDVGGGLSATVSETFKNIFGSQDEYSAARKEFNAIRSSQATVNLPPGPASDKDIELALSGFPKENASSYQVIGFLKGQAKLSRINEKFNEFKAEYIGKNNSVVGLLPAWKSKLNEKAFLSDILNPKDQLKEVQQQATDEDLLKQYGGL